MFFLPGPTLNLQYNYPSLISDLGNFYRPLSSTMGWELADISDILLSFATKLKRLRNIANKKLSKLPKII